MKSIVDVRSTYLMYTVFALGIVIYASEILRFNYAENNKHNNVFLKYCHFYILIQIYEATNVLYRQHEGLFLHYGNTSYCIRPNDILYRQARFFERL